MKTTADALPCFIADKNVELFTKHKIFTVTELHSRYEILMESYSKKLNIEALTMADMARKQILPAVSSYLHELTQTALDKKALAADLPCEWETQTVRALSDSLTALYKNLDKLETHLRKAQKMDDVTQQGLYYKDTILKDMAAVRKEADKAESLTAVEYWPFPTYTDLLYHN